MSQQIGHVSYYYLCRVNRNVKPSINFVRHLPIAFLILAGLDGSDFFFLPFLPFFFGQVTSFAEKKKRENTEKKENFQVCLKGDYMSF